MIVLENVSVSLGGSKVLEQLSLHLHNNHNYVIRGKNGAGKTILLNLIAGKIYPSAGTISYDFINSSLSWEESYMLRNKFVHYVPATALYEIIGTSPNLFYQQRYYNVEGTIGSTVRDYLGIESLDSIPLPSSFNITNLFDVELTRLSNGQIKKLIIIKQLLRSIPKILLLDHPFEGLDPESRTALSDFLDYLSEHYKTQIILTDHHHYLPTVITHAITMEKLTIKSIGVLDPARHDRENDTMTLPSHSAADGEPVVELRNVKIQYGDKIIFKNLNWRINKGERWALTGRNGSGKTTLFSLIFADHPMAYSEQVFLFGRKRGTGESIWDIKNRIAYLGPEHLHYLNRAFAGHSISEFLLEGNSDAFLQTDLVNYFNAREILNKSLKQLSTGELQLVLLIRLFLSKKELILLDEPFQFLDTQQKELVNKYLNIHLDQATTLVLITHYEKDLERWTNHRMHLS